MSDGMPFNGYAYELDEHIDPREAPLSLCFWSTARDDRWNTVMLSPANTDKRAIKELGQRRIDGAMCLVFLCADARVRAVTMVAAGARQKASA